MILTRKVIDAIKSKESSALRFALASELNFTEAWVNTLASKNKDNGPLTTVAAIAVIQDKTDIKKTEILEEKELAKAV